MIVCRSLFVEASIPSAATRRQLPAIRTLLANTVELLSVWLGQQPFFAHFAPSPQSRVLFNAGFVAQDAVNAASVLTQTSAHLNLATR